MLPALHEPPSLSAQGGLAVIHLVIAWLLGFLAGEVFQLGAWKLGHADKPWLSYVTGEAPAHWMVNLAFVAVAGVAWSEGILGPVLDKVGLATPIGALLAVSPPFGFILAALVDVLADKYAFGLLARFSKKEDA